VWLALVVFTSGIVDEGLPLAAVASQYYPVGPLWAGSQLALVVGLVGVEPGVVVGGGGFGTLLGPEASGP
jgi:hypothetical protein